MHRVPLAAALIASALAALQPAAPPPLRVDGRFFVAGSRTFRPVFTSGLALLARSEAERGAFLDEVVTLGFNGVRVFAGELGWAGQTPQGAREALPSLLQQAARRGLYVEVTAVTGSRTGYDVESHLRLVSAICSASPNCVIEAANEYYHPSQSDLVQEPQRLFNVARRAIVGRIWSLGAPPFDTLQEGAWPVPAADFITVHLDRGRPFWRQLAGVRGLARISEHTRKPVMNNEPIGAAEAGQSGRREADPRFFFALGALSRLLELGVVFHSEDGLNGRQLGPNQRRCAEGFIAGFRSIQTDARLSSAEPGSAGSAVAKVSGSAHAFCATDGARWWIILLDVSRKPVVTGRPGWTVTKVVAERRGIQVVELLRSER